MKLHCLGTAGYRPNQRRHTSCYAVPEAGLVLDAGSGLFRLAELIETDQLDILLSHAHLDHVVGLTYLLDILHQAETRRGKPVERLRVFGEAEKLAAVQGHLFSEFLFPVPLNAQWIEIDTLSSFEAGGAEVSWRRQPHPGGSVAYRVQWPWGTLVYATDTTGFTEGDDLRWMRESIGKFSSITSPASPTESASESDGRPQLLIHECNFRDEKKRWAMETGHCWTSRLAEIASHVQPERLLVAHLNPLDLEADPVDAGQIDSAFEGELWVAEDGLTLDIGSSEETPS